jgi:putative tRNA adenosine deaminase-associated protein
LGTFGRWLLHARIESLSADRIDERRWKVAQQGFAVVAFQDGAQWRVEPLPPAVLADLSVLLSALRSQPPEGGPFVIACVEDEFFVIARQEGRKIALLLSDLTAAVEFPLAEQSIARLGEDPPADDELDEVWPVGDLELFSDLGVPEEEMEDILDDLDALPEEMLETIVDRLGLAEQYAAATEAAWAGR